MSDASKELLNHAKQRFGNALQQLETQCNSERNKHQHARSTMDEMNQSIDDYIQTLDAIIEKHAS